MAHLDAPGDSRGNHHPQGDARANERDDKANDIADNATEPNDSDPNALDRLRLMRDAVRRAFREFLAVPTCVITGFLLLAFAVDAIDRTTPGWLIPVRDVLKQRVFIDAKTTGDLLGAIAAGIITVTSITVSVLLLALQQSAASMSAAVFDQFLRRRENQLSFGYFIGLGLYTLVTLATVHENANAVFGATLGVLFTVAALYVLLVLLYSTVDQMRPSVVLGSIGRLTLQARRGQRELLARTGGHATPGLPVLERVRAKSSGYVTRVDLPTLEGALGPKPATIEIVLLVSLGAFVAYGDVVAEVRGAPSGEPRDRDGGNAQEPRGDDDAESVSDAVRRSLRLEADRDIGGDPAYGIEQIHNIGWTSISSSKSNPAPGLFAIRTLRDLLARWADQPRQARSPAGVIYADDVTTRAFGALESLGVAAYESKQHQSFAEVLRAVATLVERLPGPQRAEAAAVVERLLPSLPTHIRTRLLDEALSTTAERFELAGRPETAEAVRAACRSAQRGGGGR